MNHVPTVFSAIAPTFSRFLLLFTFFETGKGEIKWQNMNSLKHIFIWVEALEGN